MEAYFKDFLLHLILCLQFVNICSNTYGDVHANVETYDKTDHRNSPCRYLKDPLYRNGIYVDCSSLVLRTIDPNWFPSSATTIDLDDNFLDRLRDTFFQFNSKLRKLVIRRNSLTHADAKTFQDLKNLQVLNLENNFLNLNEGGLNPQVFRNLSGLEELRLGYNKAKDGPYSNGLLRGLVDLKVLSLDTFRGPLNFGNLFEDLTSLKELVLTGKMSSITNDSFIGFEHIPLEILSVMDASRLRLTESNAFQHLKKLTHFSIKYAELGVRNVFYSLFPFQGRNMTSLKFDDITTHSNTSKAISESAIITMGMTKFLSRICVKHFTLIRSRIFYIDRGVFWSIPLWQNCLETIDLGMNPLEGDVLNILALGELKHLTRVRFKDCRVNAFGGRPYSRPSLNVFMDDNSKDAYIHHHRIPQLEALPSNELSSKRGIPGKLYSNTINSNMSGGFEDSQFLKKIIILLPPNLQRFEYVACLYKDHGLFHDQTIEFQHADNIKYVDISDNGFQNFLIPIRGLTNVFYFDFSHNDGRVLSPLFMDSLHSVRYLRMAGMNLNNSQSHFKSLFRNLTRLEHIDLSDNDFNVMEASTFKNNLQIKSINLAKNKFHDIPVDMLNLHPNLQKLDMTYNSIVSLSPISMSILDKQVMNVPSFSVKLAGNLLLCGCSGVKLIAWLKHTRVTLDQGRNYPCIDQNGDFTRTSKQINNLEILWRKCVGERALYISLSLLSMMILCFMVCYILFHFQTFIISGIIRMFTNNFTPKSPKDYKYGVFLGYPNEDYRFACFALRQFIEDTLKMTTYVRHRDLLPATDMAESIVEATNSSWRILLLATKNFVERDEWCYFTLKISTYCAEPLNPNRIVLLVERGILERIPRSLLRVVPEDNILVMDRPFILGPDEMAFLSNAIDFKVK